MGVIVSVRSGNVSDTLKKYAETKASKLLEEYSKITSVRVTLDMQKSRCKAEIVVRGKNIDMEADNESFDFHDSIDTVMEKISHQLDKHIDKVHDHKLHRKVSIKEVEEE